ncbi:hypothetical protein GCM10008015_12980 [Flavobacterium palustre]|uniref:Lipoprotein n=1 Tax=Flavobacterium palustre TaxID=1476463 RepID=A0ABQ1HG50_9FLAO|nr:hypothetical protein [Flavobacterium palustre]GGA73764.1 hypothetical protein GCM10008015_12980 [Flavobacterium palustre]
MKNLGLSCLLLVSIGFQSCKNEKANDTKEATKAEKPISVNCYQALYDKDTIDLKINTLKDGKISGSMVMKMYAMSEKTGDIEGEFRGDTLFADYSFIQGKNENATFKNPLAILKRGDTLILGNGKIETYLGRSYFAKGAPIDFDRVKYKFLTVDCVDK